MIFSPGKLWHLSFMKDFFAHFDFGRKECWKRFTYPIKYKVSQVKNNIMRFLLNSSTKISQKVCFLWATVETSSTERTTDKNKCVEIRACTESTEKRTNYQLMISCNCLQCTFQHYPLCKPRVNVQIKCEWMMKLKIYVYEYYSCYKLLLLVCKITINIVLSSSIYPYGFSFASAL